MALYYDLPVFKDVYKLTLLTARIKFVNGERVQNVAALPGNRPEIQSTNIGNISLSRQPAS